MDLIKSLDICSGNNPGAIPKRDMALVSFASRDGKTSIQYVELTAKKYDLKLWEFIKIGCDNNETRN